MHTGIQVKYAGKYMGVRVRKEIFLIRLFDIYNKL